MSFGETEFGISAYMKKPWINPFDTNNVEVTKAGLHVGITYSSTFSFGMQGTFQLYESYFDFIFYLDTLDVGNNVFLAEIDNLNFS